MIVYRLTCVPTGLSYVGQTIHTLDERWLGHVRHARTARVDMPITVAIREYGAEAFTREVLQECEDQQSLNRAERHWIDTLGTVAPAGYNLSRGFGRHPLSAAKTSATLMGRPCTWGDKISAAMTGRRATPQGLSALAAGREAWRTDPGYAEARSRTNGRRKVSDDDVRQIRRAYAEGESQRSIGARLGLDRKTVGKITRRERFAFIPEEAPQ